MKNAQQNDIQTIIISTKEAYDSTEKSSYQLN